MSFFIDKHGRRKSPIALAACGAALLDLAVYFCTAALLAGPLYRTVSFGGETVTSMLHTIIITVISTLLCCLLFLLKDKRVVPYGFAGLAVILLMFCAAAWMLPQETRGSMLRLFLTVGLPPGAAWQRRQLAHLPKVAEGASRVFRQKDHLGGAERGGGTGAEKEARCKAGIRSGPDAGAGYLPHRGPVWPGKLRNGSRCVP